MTKEEAFKEINDTQDFYVNELYNKIYSTTDEYMKVINFQSPTGTGKTMMMSKLMNKMPDTFFIVTTLSKGQLDKQIEKNLKANCKYDNFSVYGTQKFTICSKLQAEDILKAIPANTKFIWLRDEGHINTNRWEDLLKNKAFKMINITATPDYADIKCNFTNTMMLRTVNQASGTPEDAIKKLIEVKQKHEKVKAFYNPCAIFRCISDELTNEVINLCIRYNLKYINITEEDFDMSELCADNNEYDVIINKFKIVEGIDIRRAHVLYMDNQPSSNKTTIQVIGRCRRNALLYNNNIDIFDSKNEKLFKSTRQCFVYYNVAMRIDEDENGELMSAFCNVISVEQLKTNSTITVKDGMLPNGLKIIELEDTSGTYKVMQDKNTGFNVIKPQSTFYQKNIITAKDTTLVAVKGFVRHKLFSTQINHKYSLFNYNDLAKLIPFKHHSVHFNYATGELEVDQDSTTTDLLNLDATEVVSTIKYEASWVNEVICLINKKLDKLTYRYNASLKHKKYTCDKPALVNELNSDFLDIDFLDSKLKTDIIAKAKLKITPKDFVNRIYSTTRESFKSEQEAIQAINEYKTDIYNELSKQGLIKDKSFSITISTYAAPVLKITSTVPKEATVVLRAKTFSTLYASDFADIDKDNLYFPYNQIYNDRESAIIGTDLMKQVKNDLGQTFWMEDKSVTSKVSKSSKLNTYISNKFENEIKAIESQLFTGKNKFNFDTRCNRCLGYCVEYFSKYLVYGENYIKDELVAARKEAQVPADFINNNLIVRACMLKYVELMSRSFGNSVARLIPTIGIQQLIRDNYLDFVNTVVELGTKVAVFVKDALNITRPLKLGDKLHDPNLSIAHIAGLADYIDKHTIIDIKVTNEINKKHIKQVLAYYYLSKKRSDLDIKRVIVFDAVSGKNVTINL